ncbi:hypothetical protein HQ585_03915 [candidate division KSB1 bacterium]|nr:hypothetical protein [candidate division KSB1 bacterium]
MKRWISFTIIFFIAVNTYSRQTASHTVRIVILQPNQFEISQNTPEPNTNGVDLKEINNTDFTLDWRTSSANKRITVASMDDRMNGSLRMKQSNKDIGNLRLDDSHRELTDHLTDSQGKVQLQWIADASNRSSQPSGIVYTLTDSL